VRNRRIRYLSLLTRFILVSLILILSREVYGKKMRVAGISQYGIAFFQHAPQDASGGPTEQNRQSQMAEK
jgi:hypothetical protein